jgi:hypothetical protein
MSAQSQKSFDPEDDAVDDLREDSFDPESGDMASRSISEKSFDPECSMLDDELASFDASVASEASFDPDTDIINADGLGERSFGAMSEKSFDPDFRNDLERESEDVEARPAPRTISAAIAERAINSIQTVASHELDKLRSEVESLRAANELLGQR